MNIDLKLGDCLKTMREMEDNSVDSVVSDPPYGINFMGKKWDYDVPNVEVWEEAMRVLKPGGHILIACGTRTQHRMAVNIEDAGFEIRDIVAWVYGSGFPKSLNIGKSVDKLQGNERDVLPPKQFADGTYQRKTSTAGKYSKHRGQAKNTKGNSPYEGWGTALKPAMELWTLARKPLSEKTIAENVLKHGTGGININGCRVEYVGDTDPRTFGGSWKTDKMAKDIYEGGYEGSDQTVSTQGRFPANLIHDGSDEVVGLFPHGHARGNKNTEIRTSGIYGNIWNEGQEKDGQSYDKGSASRFFYCAKASKSERNAGLDTNNHPTVKPIKLMQYLCRLITPKDGTVLDPYMGSGSTGIACKKENFNFVGIELDEDYFKIAEARIKAHEPDEVQHDFF